MNDFTKAFRMSCSVFPECNRDFQAAVWTFPVVVAFARHNGPGSVDSRRLASMMTLALCRAARLGDEMSARLADERRAAQQREEERP